MFIIVPPFFNPPPPLSINYFSLCCRCNASLASNICKANPRSLFLAPRISTNSWKCNCRLTTAQQHFWCNYAFWGVSNQCWKLQKFQGMRGVSDKHPFEWKFQGCGDLKQGVLLGGYWYFLELHNMPIPYYMWPRLSYLTKELVELINNICAVHV